MRELRRYDYLIQRLLPTLLLKGFKAHKGSVPAPGNLVKLESAPPSEWHLSFYVEDCNDGYHLLESVKTGALMRWGNVGFSVLDEELIGAGEPARWSDEQFAFRDKFDKVYRKADFYMAIPYIDRFDGDHVNIVFRTRHGFDKKLTPVAPFAWKGITQKALLALLLRGAKAHESAEDTP